VTQAFCSSCNRAVAALMRLSSRTPTRAPSITPSAEIVRRIHETFPCEPVNPNHYGEVARRWRYCDGLGEFGIISSVTQAFCSSCNRARLSTDGQLYTCLFAKRGYDLKALVRGGASDAELHQAMAAVWQRRDDRYSEIRTAETARERKVEMSYIGG
jgi:GTP 3',8-cyclase